MSGTRGYITVAFIAALAALLLLLSLTGQALAQDTGTGDTGTGDTGTATDTTTTGDTGTAAQPTDASQLQLYFFKDGELVGVARDIPAGGQMVEFTVTDLLKGPTDDEKAQGYTTYIPEGVKMLYSTKSMTGTAYAVNLSGELMVLKDTPEQAKMALEQLVRTIKEAARTEEVNVTVDIDDENRAVDAFEALGINPKDVGLTGGEDSGEKSWLWLYILIILAAVALVLAVLVPLYQRNRKAEEAIAREVEELEGEKSKRDDKKK